MTGESSSKDKADDFLIDDRFDFDPEECNVANGKWVYNRSIEPLYTDTSCPYLDRQVSCVKNGHPNPNYTHWEWQPEDCTLPRLINVLPRTIYKLVFVVLNIYMLMCMENLC